LHLFQNRSITKHRQYDFEHIERPNRFLKPVRSFSFYVSSKLYCIFTFEILRNRNLQPALSVYHAFGRQAMPLGMQAGNGI